MQRVIISLACVAALATASTAEAKRCGGVTMSDSVTVGDQELVLNGMGIREATVFNVDVYVAGLYVPTASDSSRTLLANDVPKRLVLHFVRDVDQDDMEEAFQNGFGDAAERQARNIERLTNMMPEEISDGDIITFTYTPGSGLQVQVGRRTRGTIRGAAFARTFFSIWLGRNPPNRGLKRGLLGGECG